MNHLARLPADICLLLQATHLSESYYHKLKSSQFNHLFSIITQNKEGFFHFIFYFYFNKQFFRNLSVIILNISIGNR